MKKSDINVQVVLKFNKPMYKSQILISNTGVVNLDINIPIFTYRYAKV